MTRWFQSYAPNSDPAGCPVVATSIRDVVRPYGEQALAHIADEPREFVEAVEAAMAEDRALRLRRVDALLANTSWDRTWSAMRGLIEQVAEPQSPREAASQSRAWALAR